MPIEHDRLFKEVLTIFFSEFIDLFFPQMTNYLDVASHIALDKELLADIFSGSAEADLVMQMNFHGEHHRKKSTLVHIEVQAQPQANFGKRLFDYFMRLKLKYDSSPVYPIALFTFDSPGTEQVGTYTESFEDLEVLLFRFGVLQLNRLDWQQYAGSSNPLAAAFMAKMRIAKKERPHVKLRCWAMLAQHQELDWQKKRLLSAFIETYLELSLEEQQQYDLEFQSVGTPIQEQIMNLETKWSREGFTRGETEGFAKGAAKAALTIASHILARRLGQVEVSLLARVERLSVEQLNDLSTAAIDFTNVANLETWLNAQNVS